jgi:hypothetical protein
VRDVVVRLDALVEAGLRRSGGVEERRQDDPGLAPPGGGAPLRAPPPIEPRLAPPGSIEAEVVRRYFADSTPR